MADIARLVSANADRWKTAKISSDFSEVAKRLVAYKSRYQIVEKRTGVPWFIIAVIHERETSQRWDRSIAQGDPWDKVSTHVPAGRGPFQNWEDAAFDALVNCAPHAARWKDWTAGGALTLLEEYNGLGYANRGLPSPYIWSGTDQYIKGKYIADGVFDQNAVDNQLGCAGLIMAMREADQTISFAGEDTPKADNVSAKHIAAGSAGVVTGGAMNAFGLPVWACIVAAIVAAILFYLIVHNRSKS